MSRAGHLPAKLLAVIVAGGCVFATGRATAADLSADCSAYASVPLPAEAQKPAITGTPPACASYRSYRGIGRPVNYADARACAWKERLSQQAGLGQNEDQPLAWIIGGSLMLADIYFNGAGVKRDVPLAVRFACESDEEMVKLALPDLEKLKGAPPRDAPFEFCRYSARTITMTACTGYEAEIADAARNRFYGSLKSSMLPAQRAAFEALLAAQRAYTDAHASEVDQGGTIRSIRTMGSQDILKDLFRTEIVHFERKKWPGISGNQIKTADGILQRQYQRKLQELRTRTNEDLDQGAVSATQLAGVEKAWETYRDAWVAFARLRYPAAAEAIRAEITLRRYLLLKTI